MGTDYLRREDELTERNNFSDSRMKSDV